MGHSDFVIAGAGIIGLSLAIELDLRGASVTLLDAGLAMQQTSSAAAGMLAVDDPANPPELRPLAALSASLYPGFLDRIAELGGTRVPFQTMTTLESAPSSEALLNPHLLVPQLAPSAPPLRLLDERSLDPRQLGPAMLDAVRATRIDLRERTPLTRLAMQRDGVEITTPHGTLAASHLIDCMGTWSPARVAPRKGQMLAVKLPPGFELESVVRTPEVYLVPRTLGPHAGRVLIGATVEDAGFDLTVHPLDILTLNARASRLLPALAQAEFIESWAGLRPATVDGLPILGSTAAQPRYVVASGHFRNGILLAPATARVTAQMLLGEPLDISLNAFVPDRFPRP